MARKALPAEPYVIETVDALKALADPLRLRILLALGDGAKTVKELAAELDAGVTKLYYHVNMLERNGLIDVVERRLVSGIEERRYAAAASNWTVSPSAAASLVQAGVIGALLNVVRAELELALRAPAAVPLGDPASAVPVLSLTRLALSSDDVQTVRQRIASVMEDFGEDAPPRGKRMYNAFFTAYRAPAELGDAS